MHDYLSDAYERANRPIKPPIATVLITCLLWAVAALWSCSILLAELARVLAERAGPAALGGL